MEFSAKLLLVKDVLLRSHVLMRRSFWGHLQLSGLDIVQLFQIRSDGMDERSVFSDAVGDFGRGALLDFLNFLKQDIISFPHIWGQRGADTWEKMRGLAWTCGLRLIVSRSGITVSCFSQLYNTSVSNFCVSPLLSDEREGYISILHWGQRGHSGSIIQRSN